MANASKSQDNPVLHVVVIGFHHKKGCQVEYSYPPLIEGGPVDSNDVPPEWRHLASLALPDGAHNHMQDTIYFHLPARFTHHRTVYGVACYRQMDAKDLVNKTDDVTRSTVQKSVCVLSNLPLYGLIQAKLELITHAYFDECDFTKVELLEEMYKNLNLSLKQSLLDGGSHVYLGMSARDVVTSFKHRILLLFKLILLERKVLFTGGPVKKIVNTLLSVLSLFPGMIESGLTEAAMYNVNKAISPTLKTTSLGQGDTEEFLEIRYSHFGNSEENTPNINLKLKTSTACSNSIEPESPTMERGYELQNDKSIKKNPNNLGSDTNGNSLGLDRSNVNADRALKKIKDSMNESLKRSQTLEDSSHDSGQCEQLVFKEDHFLEDSSENNQAAFRNVMVAENNIQMDIESMVHLQAVQVGKNIPNREEYSKDCEQFSGNSSEKATVGSTRADLSLSFNDALSDSFRHSDFVEELDTPESLNQIDKEDCFSWEEDRLHLFIDHEIDGQERDRNPKEEVSLVSSFKDDSILEKSSKRSHGSTGSQSDDKDIDSAMATVGSKDGSTRESSPVSVGSASSEKSSPAVKASAIKNRLSSAFSGISIRQKLKSKVGSKDETSQPASPENDNTVIPVLFQDDFGFPLAIFAKGSICHPYLSLQYFDLLSDINVRSFVIGATNILFKQKRHLTDVVIDVSDNKIEFHDRELQKQLHLTTADLRFADILIKAVIEDNDIFLDGTEWEGGDEWLRVQFRMYLQSLLATMLQDDAKLVEDFGVHFIQAWKTTHNYRYWTGSEHSGMKDVPCGHPCQGNLGVADIRVRLAHTMQSTERGKKLNAAVNQTGKYVVQTGKAVGGALTQAKSAVSSWFSSLTSDWRHNDKQQGVVEADQAEEGKDS